MRQRAPENRSLGKPGPRAPAARAQPGDPPPGAIHLPRMGGLPSTELDGIMSGAGVEAIRTTKTLVKGAHGVAGRRSSTRLSRAEPRALMITTIKRLAPFLDGTWIAADSESPLTRASDPKVDLLLGSNQMLHSLMSASF
jgi:hypothetical protein